MPRAELTGTRIRARRTVQGLKQADLARAVGISPSYLNLIEHNRRRIGGKLLVDLARVLRIEVAALTQGAEAELLDQLGMAAAAQPEVPAEADRVDEFVGRFPGWAGLAASQARRIEALERRVAGLTDRLAHDPVLSASLHDVLTKVAAIRATASILAETPDLDEAWRGRFHRNLHGDSVALAESSAALVGYLDHEEQAEPGLVTPQEELEAWLEASDFHVAALERSAPPPVAEIVEAAGPLRSEAARAMARTHLERYARDAAAMPLARVADAAEALDCDPTRVAAAFGVDLPAAFRRLAALPPVEGGRLGLAVCDGSGTLTLRKGVERFALPRFGAACALWPLYQALSRPMTPLRMRLEHGGSPGHVFVAYAYAQPRPGPGFDGPMVQDAYMLIVPPERAGENGAMGPVQRVGTTCRVCQIADCVVRREPSVLSDSFDSGP